MSEHTPVLAEHPILVVDDDHANLELIEGRLSVEGLASVLVETAAEALAAAAAQEFQAVLLDLRLPDGDGLDVLRRLRARQPHLPVIIMTAHGSETAAVTALSAGASDYLIKPVSRRDLLFALRKAIDRGDRADARPGRPQLLALLAGAGIETAAGRIALEPLDDPQGRNGVVVRPPVGADLALAALARAIAVGLADTLGARLEDPIDGCWKVSWPAG